MSSPARDSGYLLVAEQLQKQIREGQFLPGTLLPTERELAERFQVSRNTLRRALRHLAERGWAQSIPNRGVVAIMGPSEPRKNIVGFVDSFEFEPHLFFALSSLLQSSGFVLTHVNSDNGGTEGAIEFCCSQGYAGAFVWSKTINPDRQRFESVLQRMPIIAVDHSLRGIDTDVVACDVYQGAVQAVHYLAQIGSRRIGIAGMLDSLDTTQDRFGGFLEGMFTSGQQPKVEDFLFTRTSDTEPDLRRLEQRLAEPNRPDALLVMQDHTLPDIFNAARNVDLLIPADLRVVAIGTAGYDGYHVPTINFDWQMIAEALVNCLYRRLDQPASSTVRIVLPAKLLLGEVVPARAI